MVKSRIDFYRREIARVKFQPAARWQVRGIKVAAPSFEAPGASPEPDFLLSRQVQVSGEYSYPAAREALLASTVGPEQYGLSNLTERVS
jgi:hypothetical protein